MDELIASILKRQDWSKGIGLASQYMRSIFDCRDGSCGVMPEDIASAESWAKELDAGAKRLVYTDSDTIVTSGMWEEGGVEKRFGKKGLERTSGSCLDFEGIMTTTSKDRDGDILETKGAEPDETMLLLWQHMPFNPIGKLCELTAHTGRKMAGHFAILDNAMGNDVAQMVEFKMLGLSIGFIPTEYEWIKEGEGDKVRYTGWHVKKFKVLECSLVSIRSNEDCLVTAMSKQKLHHPLVKLYASLLRAKMPEKVVSGFEGGVVLEKKEEVVEKSCGCHKAVEKAVEQQEDVNSVAAKLIGMVMCGKQLDAAMLANLDEIVAQEKQSSQERILASWVN